jgi:hypothetical protein
VTNPTETLIKIILEDEDTRKSVSDLAHVLMESNSKRLNPHSAVFTSRTHLSELMKQFVKRRARKFPGSTWDRIALHVDYFAVATYFIPDNDRDLVLANL